jgi:hypothetical protein
MQDESSRDRIFKYNLLLNSSQLGQLGWACSTNGRDEKFLQYFNRKNVTGKYHLRGERKMYRKEKKKSRESMDLWAVMVAVNVVGWPQILLAEQRVSHSCH